MERVLRCLSPVHIGTGKKIEPFDYVLVDGRYVRVNLDAFFERLGPEGAERLNDWLNQRAEQLTGLQDQLDRARGPAARQVREQMDEKRREMNLLNFVRGNQALERALGQDRELAYYRGRAALARNLQVEEQLKDAEARPMIPGSSFKGAIRTALAYLSLVEHPLSGQELQGIQRLVEEAKRERASGRKTARLEDQLGQEIERLVFRCGRRQGGRTSFDDIHCDLMRVVSVSDTFGSSAELIVSQAYTFVEDRRGDARGVLQAQAPLQREAHAPGNTFRFRVMVDTALMQTIAAHPRPDEWLGFEEKVERVFGQQARGALRGDPQVLAAEVLARMEEACRRFALAVIAEEEQWAQRFGVARLREFYASLRVIGAGQPLIRLGWGSHFLSTTLLLALRENPAGRALMEECVRVFDLGVPPRKRIDNWQQRRVDLEGFPRSRRLVAVNRNPVSPFGWAALAVSEDQLPAALVDSEEILRMPALERRRPPRSQGSPPVGPGAQAPQPPEDPAAADRLFRQVTRGTRQPATRSGPKTGDRVEVEILENDGRQVRVRVLGPLGEEVRISQAFYQGRPGDKRRMRVQGVDAQGRITRLAP